MPPNTQPTPSDEQPAIPAPMGRTILIAAVALAISLGLTRWLDISSSRSYTAYLHSHVTLITADCDARIHEILIDEGEMAEAGQAIFLLKSEGATLKPAVKRREVSELGAELEQSRAKAEVDLAWRLKNLRAEILETRLKSANFLKARFNQRVEEYAWQKFLEQSDNTLALPADVFQSLVFESTQPDETRVRAMLNHEAAHNAIEVSSVLIDLCERRLKELEKLESDLPEKIQRAAGLDAAESRLAWAREELQQIEQPQTKRSVTTPAYGTVGIYRKKVGERVAVGEPIVELLDGDRRFLTLQIPSRSLPHFAVDAEVALEFPGGDQRTGIVRRIPPQTSDVGRDIGTSDSDDAPITLRIDPVDRLWPEVPIGSAVTVRVKN